MRSQSKAIYDTKPALQRIFKGILHTEEKEKCNHENVGETNHTR
jgi:hypothetical protein